MVAATAVTVEPIADLGQDNLQNTLGAIYGKAVYAAGAAGDAKGQAEWAAGQVGGINFTLTQHAASIAAVQTVANDAKGQAQYAADNIGFFDYHLRAIADLVGHTIPPAP